MKRCWACLSALVLCWSLPSSAADVSNYGEHELVGEFINEMVETHGFDGTELRGWFAQAERKQSILDAISRPAEKALTWKEYRRIFVNESRTRKGVEFWHSNQEALKRAEEVYGVPPEMVVAIIGAETRYGTVTGSYRVIDALSTLAFDYPKRSAFFRKELENFLLLARDQKLDPMTLKGSYAGAMGYGQFMPSSYRSYAVDFDGDDKIDIWENPTDAIGSVANYFNRHGWKAGELVTSRARIDKNYDRDIVNQSLKPELNIGQLAAQGFSPIDSLDQNEIATAIKLDGEHGAEFWLGLHNFYVITRYNKSKLYAMAVYQLSQSIKEKV